MVYGWIVCILLLVIVYYSSSVGGGLSDLLKRKREKREEADLIDRFPDYVLPRQDMKAEYGLENYNLVVADALGVDDYVGGTEEDLYGVDVSYPIHQPEVVKNTKHPERQQFYDRQIQGCREYYTTKADRCNDSEYSRLGMNIQQPRTMQNYTALGYAKVKAPKHVFQLLEKFWDANKQPNYGDPEVWPAGNTYTNHWSSPTHMIDISNRELIGGGIQLRNRVFMELQPILSQWVSGLPLEPVSLYGIRVYTKGAILAPHVDRLPLVTSAIINIAQDVEEEWPLEVYGHDGVARNITMEPGDMILYESHSVIHGRPFELRGNHFANVFIHFEPIGHTQKHSQRTTGDLEKAGKLYRNAMQQTSQRKGSSKQRSNDQTCDSTDSVCQQESTKRKTRNVPDYIPLHSDQELKWKQEKQYEHIEDEKSSEIMSNTAHEAAKFGDLPYLKELAKTKRKELFAKDRNGWQPLHEAARAGHTTVVKLLVEEGAEVNARTNNERGGTPLYWALQKFGKNHPTSMYLKEQGGKNIAPEFEKK